MTLEAMKMNPIIERLAEAIEKSDLSYAELEKRTGIAKSSIQRYATGLTKKIPIDAVQSIAKATNSSAAYIMGWADEQTQKKNDAITDIILKMRRDENLIDAIKELCELSPEHISSVKAFITVLKQQHINNVE
jgi:transcriptional regulator with XRE-family HTH domain